MSKSECFTPTPTSFFLHFFVEDLAKEINARPQLETPSILARLVMATFLTSDVVILIFTPGKWAT